MLHLILAIPVIIFALYSGKKVQQYKESGEMRYNILYGATLLSVFTIYTGELVYGSTTYLWAPIMIGVITVVALIVTAVIQAKIKPLNSKQQQY